CPHNAALISDTRPIANKRNDGDVVILRHEAFIEAKKNIDFVLWLIGVFVLRIMKESGGQTNGRHASCPVCCSRCLTKCLLLRSMEHTGYSTSDPLNLRLAPWRMCST